MSPLSKTSPSNECPSLQGHLRAAEGAQASGLNEGARFSAVKMRGEQCHAQPALKKNGSENFDRKGCFFQCEESKNKMTFP